MKKVFLLNFSAKKIGIYFILPALLLTFLASGNLPRRSAAQKRAASDAALYQGGQTASVIGADGDYTVTSSGAVLNNYAVLGAAVAAGSATFTVTNIADLDSSIPQLGTIAAGDLLMIVQMQGATIDTTDTVSYGSVTALNSAGLYEFVTIGSISANTITINGEGCITGLRNSYTTTGRTQVIRVPQFKNLTINSGASVVPAAWDGTKGGVVALQVSNTMTISGSVSADSAGFRGGVVDNNSSLPGGDIYRSANSADGAEKGEGIAGFGVDYDLLSGRYGRGAPANGGGGGNSHNAGGGGGSNGNNANTWTGQGVMPGGNAAWQLDPGYIANGNALTNSSGGGRGGYTYSANNQDALTVAPGNTTWGGDNRRERGGLGGRPVTNNPASRVFLGGGGGAGDANNSVGGAGGKGGGMVFLIGPNITGTGTISANGQNGANTGAGGNDAPGGGGAGGSVVVSSSGLTVAVNTNGGAGGNQIIASGEAEGPGGGGGGGYIAIRTGTPTRTVNGGSGGTTNSTSLTEFTRNGSTNGAAGVNNGTVTTIPICLLPTAAGVGVSGRLLTPDGRGLVHATVAISDAEGNIRTAISSPFGYYRFDGVVAGRTYILSVSSKRYQFAPRVVTVYDEVRDLDIRAEY